MALEDFQQRALAKDQPAPVEEELKRRKWRWIGHTLRKTKEILRTHKSFKSFFDG
jgi:hypothetical protein